MTDRSVTKQQRPLVDPMSFELAEHFLQDHPHCDDITWGLAAAIQTAVEDWFEYREMVTKSRSMFKDRLASLAVKADATDGMIMLWGQRNPRVCASNHPTGEHINYGGRRQL